ncbi:family 16 glycoside hydrolase [Bradyrhizobium pachyrhizi]|uniref:family 16 glycoside hydrolase n=1 Tax=Bradyrhizobium pachyrhizi TaxID=280333 RepID=UPI003D36F4CE
MTAHDDRRQNRRSRSATLVAAVAALYFMGSNAMADSAASFEADAIGGPPAGWTATKTGTGKPKWTVEQDATAPSHSRVVKQSGNATYPVLLKNDTNIKDGFIEMKFKPIAGSEDRAAGLVWRAKDADNYYVLRANALEDNVVLYKTVKGVRRSLDIVGRAGGYGVKIAVPANQWSSLRVEFAGSRFKAIYNGKTVFEVEDGTFADAGMVGLWTKADSVTLFDAITYGSAK